MFTFSVNEKHFPNRQEGVKLLEDVIIPYVKERAFKNLSVDKKSLLIMDVSTEELTPEVLELLENNHILF